MLAAATIANIKIRYDAKTPQFGTRVICVFYSILQNMWDKVVAEHAEGRKMIDTSSLCFSTVCPPRILVLYWQTQALLGT